MTRRLDVDLADQWAGGVDIDHFATDRFRRYGFGHAVGRKNDGAIIGALIEFFDKDCPFVAQTIDDKLIVDDFVPDKDRRPPFFQCHFDNLYGAVHTGTKAAGGG
jgi:hypothetical protein